MKTWASLAVFPQDIFEVCLMVAEAWSYLHPETLVGVALGSAVLEEYLGDQCHRNHLVNAATALVASLGSWVVSQARCRVPLCRVEEQSLMEQMILFQRLYCLRHLCSPNHLYSLLVFEDLPRDACVFVHHAASLPGSSRRLNRSRLN